MAALYLYDVFDDPEAGKWAPFSSTRPVGELLFGCRLLRERIEVALGLPCRGHLAGRALAEFSEEGAPPGVVPGNLPDDEARLVIASRWIPEGRVEVEMGEEAARLRCSGEEIGWWLPPGAELPPPWGEGTGADQPAPEVEVPGATLETIWGLVDDNARRIAADVPLFHPHDNAFLPPQVERLGTHPVSVGEDVALEPGVVLDARKGPIRIDDGGGLAAHTVLRGPAYVGRESQLLGGVFSEISAGPRCKLRGEVEASVVLGFSNKAHDGYLGHAYVGRWVNLGALTTNSDLKNNYGPVRIGGRDGEIDTGLLKFGCLLGDHVKTGIGTLLNTGTVVGPGANLFGPRMPPKYVPPFAWGAEGTGGSYRFQDFVETAARVMERREQELDEGMRRTLRGVWERSRHGGAG